MVSDEPAFFENEENINAMIDVANRYRVTLVDAMAFLEEAGYFNE